MPIFKKNKSNNKVVKLKISNNNIKFTKKIRKIKKLKNV